MVRLIALVGLTIGGLGSLFAAVTAPKLEFSSEPQLQQHAALLRTQGPEGLVAALARIDQLTSESADRLQAIEQMRRCVDLTAGQRDAWASRLYWYTDLAAAKAAAAQSGKPILSLRLLGKLTDEYSCANSRFFRTALYANQGIGKYLREKFVLHWQSVRPAPRVTIDFGDGRKLERTVTGNSVHYVLDASGRTLDALPGLYGPQAFGEWLKQCAALHSEYAAAGTPQARDHVLTNYHVKRRAALDKQFQSDLATAAPELLLGGTAPSLSGTPDAGKGGQPTAAVAATRALTKSVVETPIIATISLDFDRAASLDAGVWQRIAQLPGRAAELDSASKQLMRREFPTAAVAGALAGSKFKVEDPLVRLVQSFESSISVDSVKNEYLLHRRVHDWFVTGEVPADFDALNERIYAELFLTPSSDPWLGLAPANVYTGFDGGGLTAAAADATQLGAAP
jgi:hypothetical protein